jgi:putative ABC transport system ATP-binding protein
VSLINLDNIIKIYGKEDSEVLALKGIHLSIQKGEMIAIMGTSGSGKSTLLNIIGCLDRSTSGDYFLNNKNIESYSNKELVMLRNKMFGFVVQYFALIEDYSVYENVVIPLEYAKVNKKQKKERVIKILKELGVGEKIDKFPSELSGGQNQRVAIARALVNEPEIILADEPTGALDNKTSQEIMSILRKLNENGKTIIIVTHDENIANQCDRILKIEDGIIYSSIDKRITR